MQTDFKLSIYASIMSMVTQQVAGECEDCASFFRMAQVYTNRTARTLKSNAFMTIPSILGSGMWPKSSKGFELITITSTNLLPYYRPLLALKDVKEYDSEDLSCNASDALSLRNDQLSTPSKYVRHVKVEMLHLAFTQIPHQLHLNWHSDFTVSTAV